MTDPLIPIAHHVEKGDALLLALKSARERGRIAEHVCALRRWHRAMQPLVAAYSAPLAESLRQLDPRPEEYARVGGAYTSKAQVWLLMTTATVLYRLKPHLSAVRHRKKPGRKPGQGEYNDLPAIEKMHSLVTQDGLSVWAAAQHATHLADQRNPEADTITRRIDKKYRKLYPK